MDRQQAIEWLVENFNEWPEHPAINKQTDAAPKKWHWTTNGVNITLMRSGFIGINRLTWQDALAPQSVAQFSPKQALKWLVENLNHWPCVTDDLFNIKVPDGWIVQRRNGKTIEFTSLVSGHTIELGDWLDAVNLLPNHERVGALPATTTSIPMPKTKPPKPEGVTDPPHYLTIDNIKAIEIIAAALTLDEWRGYCLGNFMKYRLRAGKKDDLLKDIAKADEHDMLFERYKKFCRVEPHHVQTD